MNDCVRCDKNGMATWNPLVRQYLCSHCMDKWTAKEMRSPETAANQICANMEALQWLL